ncbi:MAG: 50S ribosome-binding GTPase [Kiritimatiellae bacterium]|nr:50S ribosome-binding GTPase [Kiritimatiellia bacterium]
MTNGHGTENSIADRYSRRQRLKEEKDPLVSLKKRLDSLRFWRPAPDLSKVVDETLSVINELEERLEANAIVAVVGGTGAGKSTLVNALCGKDGTVKEGVGRPTTRNITALARTSGDANVLLGHFGPDEISVVQDCGFRFHDVVLVDTPDTDSSECADYSDLLDRVLERADALVCVFPAQDPKRRDNLTRLAKKVAKYRAEHVFLVLNQCDRINKEELDEIRRDFEQNMRMSWTKTGSVYLVSARASLEKPDWPACERPLHDVNEFTALCAAIEGLDGAHFADKRIERARELRLETEAFVRNQVRTCGDWESVCRDVEKFEEDLSVKLVELGASRFVTRMGDLSSILYRNVAGRWHGPIGMYLHIGLFVRSVGSSLRYLNPFNWPGKVISRFQGALGKKHAEEGSLLDDAISFDWDAVKGVVLEGWPGISKELVDKFKMAWELRDGEKAVVFDNLEETLRREWPQNLSVAIDKMAKAKSLPFWQIFWHLPLIAMSCWALWQMFWTYCEKNYLPHDFYPHLGFILLFLWLVPSWIVQSRAGGAGAKIKEMMKKELMQSEVKTRMFPVLQDVKTLKDLC